MTKSIGNVLGGCEFSHGENGAPGDRALPTAEPQGNQAAKIPESRINGAAAMLQRAGFMRSVAGDEDFFASAKAWATSVTLRKGMFVMGDFGCGKTHLVKAMKHYMPGIAIVSLGDPNDASLIDLDKNLDWCKVATGMNICLDDLGSEATLNDYGSVRERAGEFITFYHLHGRGMLYVTTNLNSEELERRYTMRVLSRLKDLTVPLRMKGGDKRRFYGKN